MSDQPDNKKIILPGDPEKTQPLVMGDAYTGEHLPPKLAQEKRNTEFDQQRKELSKTSGYVPYPNSSVAVVPDPWYPNLLKTSQAAGISNVMTNPMWFSPLHTPQSWQIASKRREVYQWARFFYSGEPKVAAAIDFYCFTPDTQILLANGSQKSISSIRVGDIVRSHDGTSNKVVRKFERQADEDIIKLYISGISIGPLKCSQEHKLIVYRDNKTTFIKAKDICVGDYLVTPALFEENNTGPIINNDLAWLIGIYAAEGCGIPYEHVDKDGKLEQHFKGVYFTLNISEEILAKQISDKILQLYGRETHVHKLQDGSMKLSVYGTDIADDLHGLCPGTSKYGTKRLAPHVLNWHNNNLRNILCGFMSGDGCFNKRNGLQGVGVSKILCEQIANICDRLGLAYSFTSTRLPDNRQVAYNVRVSRSSCDQIKENCYKISDINVDETHSRNNPYFLSGRFIVRQVRKIRIERYTGTLHDMEVDNAHTYVANRVACSNSQFPMNGFKLECKNNKILKWFKHHVIQRLQLNEMFKQVSSEYFMIGDVFVHLEIDCPICLGSAINPETNERCNHPGGSFKKIIIMNPDWIEVQQTPIVDEPNIVFIPDEELKRIIFYRQPKNVYDKIPDNIKELILQNKPIPLSNRTTSHLKHMPVPYGTYGTSLIRRLFTTLAYKTKILTANWIVAERLILPVRVVKIGSDNRPASTADIADVQQQLAATANDPNLTVVTHHNFDYDFYGACHDSATEVLTDDGFKTYDQVDISKDKIICYDVYTSSTKCMYATAKHEYDYDSEMVHFAGRRLDIMVTPNHRMLYKWGNNDKWKVEEAGQLKYGSRLLGKADYEGNIKANEFLFAEKDYFYVNIDDEKIELKEFCRFIGYYLSEGTLESQKSNYHVTLYQNDEKSCFADMKESVNALGYHVTESIDNRNENDYRFVISNKNLVLFIQKHFNHGSLVKRIPNWIKNLPSSYLKYIFYAMINGDGHKLPTIHTESFVYSTVSKQLANDIQEIAFKCGYSTHIRKTCANHPLSFGKNTVYRVHISMGKFSNGSYPIVRKKHIKKVPYKGKVWCFTVPTGFFVTRRNGKITIQGNSGKILQVTQEMEHIDKEILDGMMLNQSLLNGEMSGYQSAAVGVETLIRRIESWRHKLAAWAEEKIFKPIAEMQGFIDKEESDDIGETIYLYPRIKWNDLNLKDNTQFNQLLMQLHDKQVLSTQTLLEKLDLNYDQEVQRRRYEAVQVGPAGSLLGAGGGMGGAPMGAPGGGLGGLGGAGGPMPGPEGMSPMAPGGDLGGGLGGGDLGGGAMPGPGAMAGFTGKIMKKGKEDKTKEQPMAINVPLTKIEQQMVTTLIKVAHNLGISSQHIRVQFPVQNPEGGKPFMMDFALPKLKLGIECDGYLYHSTPEQQTHDQHRDQLLAQRGWTVLRFTDKAIEEAPQEVEATVTQYVQKAAKQPKHASVNGANKLFGSSQGKLIDFGQEYQDYFYHAHPEETK